MGATIYTGMCMANVAYVLPVSLHIFLVAPASPSVSIYSVSTFSLARVVERFGHRREFCSFRRDYMLLRIQWELRLKSTRAINKNIRESRAVKTACHAYATIYTSKYIYILPSTDTSAV